MEQIVLKKAAQGIRKNGLQVRIAADVNDDLLELSETTGLSKSAYSRHITSGST